MGREFSSANVKIPSEQKSDNEGFRAKNIPKDKESHFKMIKGSISQENITILKVYVSTKRSSKYIRQKQIQLRGEITNPQL